MLCRRITIWVGRVLKTQPVPTSLLLVWVAMYWLTARSGANTSVMGSVVWLGLGSWQKFKPQDSWEKQVLTSHTVQLGKTEAGLARARHSYWVWNSFPAKKTHTPWGKENIILYLSHVSHCVSPGPRQTLPSCCCQYKCE